MSARDEAPLYYDRGKTFAKAAAEFAKSITSSALALALIDAASSQLDTFPQTWEEFQAAWPALLVALAFSMYKAWANWSKHRDKGAPPPAPAGGTPPYPPPPAPLRNGFAASR